MVSSLPFIFIVFQFPIGLTWQIILSAIFVVPIGGFALMGINDDPLSIFVTSFWNWQKNRKIMEYRGEMK